ncbi:hypothetical protein KSP40_PGU012906 [Platanthera guangdongensis]|uniref:Uncharacterized protein n=1 Tax=Platanthera guangdongensis TaxID=2320717 RepID=A0ABR2MFS3_9ASPA
MGGTSPGHGRARARPVLGGTSPEQEVLLLLQARARPVLGGTSPVHEVHTIVLLESIVKG